MAFDFDGTLTIRDSFTAFLRWRSGALPYALAVLRMVPDLIRYIGDRDRGALKTAAVRALLRGVPRRTLEADAERFAEARCQGFLRPDALARWTDWKARGATLVIVTASPETTVAPFARRLGADRLLGTRLAFDGEDRVAGAFAGENCRGAEKVRRLREAFGDDLRLAAAYGDTSGDTEMLAIADEPGWRVFTSRP